MAMESGATTQEHYLQMFHQFDITAKKVEVFRNTDLSVNGHVSDAEQWLIESYPRYDVDILDRGEEIGLGMHINQFRKKAKPYPGAKRQVSFLPMSRMVDDWLYRFARGLSQWSHPGTKGGDFPNPYAAEVCSAQKQARTRDEGNTTLPDNVISLEQVRRNKKR